MPFADSLARLPSLRRLRAFDHVASAGGLNAAAATLHITQPAVTNAVQSLESELGTRLFERGATGASLTAAGHILRRRTTRLFAQVDAALHVAAGAPQSVVPRRLGAGVTGTQIRSLIAIWEAGSFRAAAEMLTCSQPAIHRPARALERSLRSSLFRKTPQGVELSRPGAELARRLSVAMREIVSGLEELKVLAGRPQSRLTIGSLVLAPKRLLAAAGQSLLNRHPESHLEIREDSYEELMRLLRGGALDMVFGALREPPLEDDLTSEGFFTDPYAIVCRKDHPLTRRSRLTSRDLAAYDWVLPTVGLPRRAVLEEIVAKWRLRLRGSVETTSLATIVAFLAESDRLSLLSRDFFLVGGASDLLVALDLRVPQPARSVGLTTRRDWLATDFQSEFVSALRSECALRKSRTVAALRPASAISRGTKVPSRR